MSLVSLTSPAPLPQANAQLVDVESMRRELESQIQGEVRFDKVSRALYSTDASVYQMEPLGVLVVKSREDVIAAVRICERYRCPLTLRGGGTSQAGQAIGSGLQIDTSKYYNRILELNVEERWVRVEPGIVLDELNAHLRPHGLRFAPDISTASRATIGGMMANNSSGARSVLYGKTIDHVLEQTVLLSDGSVTHLRTLSATELEAVSSLNGLEGECYRVVRRIASECAKEIEQRYPKILRRVGGYNLDEFTPADKPFNLAKLMVGSEGTLGVVLEAKLNLVRLPQAKAVVSIQFHELLDALAATPVILKHQPSAVEVMDGFILSHTKQSAALERLRTGFIEGDPGALLCVEFYGESREALLPRLEAFERELEERRIGYYRRRMLETGQQAGVWSLREAALGLSMAMKEDAKSISFVEDTAVAPEKLRDYIERFLEIIRRNGTTAGIYAHASVGCLHVRPVVNLKTEEGVRKFEAIAGEVSDLVLEFGGSLSGEHGDGLVRSPFMRKMFGPALYEAFRTIKKTFDPQGIFNPGKIVDAPPLTANLRFGAGYRTPDRPTFFDYAEHGGLGGAVEMCSGLGACRKKLEGTMCPSYMATREEAHSTRGRANVLRLAMAGRLGEAGLADKGVLDVLDLCLECRACKAECPVGVDMARFKSEFLADYWSRHGAPLSVKALAHAHTVAKWGSFFPALANRALRSGAIRKVNEKLLGIDQRRAMPLWSRRTLASITRERSTPEPVQVWLFNDTFTNYYNPEIGVASLEVLESVGLRTGVTANVCCGRPLISKGLLKKARAQAESLTELLHRTLKPGQKILFCEPSCLSAVREDLPALLRGEAQGRAKAIAESCMLFEEFLESKLGAGRRELNFRKGPPKILLHGHCHQKAMGLLPSSVALLSRLPGTIVMDLDAGCCGMAGSFGYSKAHFDISREIGERRLFPAVRNKEPETVVVASGMSCRHQVRDFTGEAAIHPAILLRSLLQPNP
ncbi:MAG: FAD-binding and (Fe-S)-binding domain-containing protein [Bryobacteraceae bacterium]